ncbi:MAG: CDP-alcohol phosphatidyltransferase family protein [Gammaproteobacteria bacterium]|nr:CDP-alcohol phosphatidyltransferase family protein [Gammaproteobacteria bacterium]
MHMETEPVLPWYERLRAAARSTLYGWIEPLAARAVRFGLTPNRITTAGCLLSILAAGLVYLGYWGVAGAVFLFAGGLDMLDGAVARNYGQATRFGALLDSTLDRIGEGALFIAVALHYTHSKPLLFATLMAWFTSLLTSYVRARTEGLGGVCSEGWITRPERVILLAAGLMFGGLEVVVWLLAAGGGFTVAQRLWLSRRGFVR